MKNKRIIGSKVNKPLVFVLFVVLAINYNWTFQGYQSMGMSSQISPSKETPYVITDQGTAVLMPSVHEPSADVYDARKAESKTVSSPAENQATGTPTQKGNVVESKSIGSDGQVKAVTKEEVQTRIPPAKDTKSLLVRGDTGVFYKVIVTRECDGDDTHRVRCRVRTDIPNAEERRTFLSAYNLTKDNLKDEDKNIDTCETCLRDFVSASALTDKILNDTWLSELEDAVKQTYARRAEALRAKKQKENQAKNEEDLKKSKELRKKILDCELAEDSTDFEPRKLSKDEKFACIEKRIEDLRNADADDKDELGRKKSDVLVALVAKVKGHLKKCLANEESRLDSNCLQLAESIQDATDKSEVKAIHNISHQMQILIAQGDAAIENAKIMDQLKVIRAGMANADLVARRTGNFMPLTMYQQRLGQLHQYFLASQLRREQFLRLWEMDPEIGLTSLNELNNDYMMLSRIEEEFQNAARPSSHWYRGFNNGFRLGIPPYSPIPFGPRPIPFGPYGPALAPVAINPYANGYYFHMRMVAPPMYPHYGPFVPAPFMGPIGPWPRPMGPTITPYGVYPRVGAPYSPAFGPTAGFAPNFSWPQGPQQIINTR